MIEIKNIKKFFKSPRGKVTVFDDFSLKIKEGVFLGVE